MTDWEAAARRVADRYEKDRFAFDLGFAMTLRLAPCGLGSQGYVLGSVNRVGDVVIERDQRPDVELEVGCSDVRAAMARRRAVNV